MLNQGRVSFVSTPRLAASAGFLPTDSGSCVATHSGTDESPTEIHRGYHLSRRLSGILQRGSRRIYLAQLCWLPIGAFSSWLRLPAWRAARVGRRLQLGAACDNDCVRILRQRSALVVGDPHRRLKSKRSAVGIKKKRFSCSTLSGRWRAITARRGLAPALRRPREVSVVRELHGLTGH